MLKQFSLSQGWLINENTRHLHKTCKSHLQYKPCNHILSILTLIFDLKTVPKIQTFPTQENIVLNMNILKFKSSHLRQNIVLNMNILHKNVSPYNLILDKVDIDLWLQGNTANPIQLLSSTCHRQSLYKIWTTSKVVKEFAFSHILSVFELDCWLQCYISNSAV